MVAGHTAGLATAIAAAGTTAAVVATPAAAVPASAAVALAAAAAQHQHSSSKATAPKCLQIVSYSYAATICCQQTQCNCFKVRL